MRIMSFMETRRRELIVKILRLSGRGRINAGFLDRRTPTR
jgi:hypothetical protein